MSLAFETITSLRGKLKSKEISPVDIVQSLFERIDAHDPSVGAYLALDRERALADAAAADVSGPLGGIPIAVKDVIGVLGQSCTCASKILKGYVAPYDATAIARLREAGAFFVGRMNMDEFAMGASTENSGWGLTRNPWDQARTPGGSSGGSAAAVAGHLAIAGLGSDTGGSIRQPAGMVSCVGFKPTYGRISRYGLVAFVSSLDQIGPLTKTVEDTALLLQAMAGHDPADNTSAQVPVPDYRAALAQGVKGLRIGVAKEYFIDGIHPEVEKAVRAAIAQLESLGAKTVEVSLPHTQHAIATYYIIVPAEASANLARFDGVRYGHRAQNTDDLLEMYGRTRGEGFGSEVKRRIILGTYVLSSGYHDAFYNRAQKVRQLIRQDFEQAFEKCDVIAAPTSPAPAFKLGDKVEDPLQMYLEDIFTAPANLAGNCGISIPCGFTKENLPIGFQLLGPHFGEATILRAAHAYEQSTDWHKRRPPLE